MKRTLCWMMSFAGVAVLLAAGACSSSDDDDDGNTTTATTSTGTGTGSGGSAPSCYRCADYTLDCADGCPAGDPFELVCEESLPLMIALNNCVCSPTGGDCQQDCAGTCSLSAGGAGGAVSGTGGAGGAAVGGMDSGQGGDSPNCMTCQAAAIQAACEDAWNACLADSSI